MQQNKLRLSLLSLALFGLSLVIFSLSTNFLLSLVLTIIIGGAAAAFDTLQQTILQLSVPDELRGRVMGYWVASLGFGPLGHLEMGAAATLFGAPAAQMANGLVVLVSFTGAALWVRRSGVAVALGKISPGRGSAV